MDNLKDIIQTRRSIRKFADSDISDNTIKEIIEAGMYAPSGCNSQCWQFVAVKDKAILERIVAGTKDAITEIYKNSDFDAAFFESRIKQITFYKAAPVVIFVFMTQMHYYDERVTEYYTKNGLSYEERMSLLGSPDILSVGAAIQNMLLTIHQKGLGACWMNDPVVAGKEICRELNVPDSWQLMSVIPVGEPLYIPRTKRLKKMEEVLEIR